jgi:hypothetical protein
MKRMFRGRPLDLSLAAAKGFLPLALSVGQIRPRVINVDGHPAYVFAIETEQAGKSGRHCQCRSSG